MNTIDDDSDNDNDNETIINNAIDSTTIIYDIEQCNTSIKNIDDEISRKDINDLIDDMSRLVMQPGAQILHVLP